MKKQLFLLIVLACAFVTSVKAEFQLERPKLVVGIVVDQMRWDYLYRYYNQFGEGGLKRLINDGYNFENMHYNYVPTVTAAGHASVFSGTTPAFHGIAGNNYYLNGKKAYCCGDTTVQTVGSKSKAGQMSPRNMMVTNMCDQLRLATDFRSRVIGVSIKDRASILPAGHSANGAFWFDKSAGCFITSTYYMQDLPQWLKDFNKKNKKDLNQDIAPLPIGVTLTTRIAIAALDGEQLGKNPTGDTDMLTVSYSSTDYVGHSFGTRGEKTDEIYLTLDRELKVLFDALDQRVGRGNYLLFLTADHAGCHNAKFMNDHKMPGGVWKQSAKKKELNALYAQKYGITSIISDFFQNQVHLNRAAIEAKNLDFCAVRREIAAKLAEDSLLMYAVPFEEVGSSSLPPAIRDRVIMGYCPGRSGDIQVITRSGYMDYSYEQGTTHVAWNPYDTHVPFIIMGWHVNHGFTNRPVAINDIAPTVCAMLKIQMPTGCTGNAIYGD